MNGIMTDLEQILPLWRELSGTRREFVLVTVVATEGSSYRKPGAMMLVCDDGRRAGTVSGGCLEAEVARRAWWLTAQGPVVQRYSTQNEFENEFGEEPAERPYGSGCGGVVSLLLERAASAEPLLRALEQAFEQRTPLAVSTVLDGPGIGARAFVSQREQKSAPELPPLLEMARESFLTQTTFGRSIDLTGSGKLSGSGKSTGSARAWAAYLAPRLGLWVFGAGDDAKPVVKLARELGWFVAVVDGRAHLATRARFAEAHEVTLPRAGGLRLDGMKSTDAAVLLSHSFEQDTRALMALLTRKDPPAYIGLLGPERRARELLAEVAHRLGIAPETFIRSWMPRLHAPVGLDLGANAPAAIALSIVAEIQQSFTGASGRPLCEKEATNEDAVGSAQRAQADRKRMDRTGTA